MNITNPRKSWASMKSTCITTTQKCSTMLNILHYLHLRNPKSQWKAYTKTPKCSTILHFLLLVGGLLAMALKSSAIRSGYGLNLSTLIWSCITNFVKNKQFQPGQQTLHCAPPQTSLQPPSAQQHCAGLPTPLNSSACKLSILTFNVHFQGQLFNHSFRLRQPSITPRSISILSDGHPPDIPSRCQQ